MIEFLKSINRHFEPVKTEAELYEVFRSLLNKKYDTALVTSHAGYVNFYARVTSPKGLHIIIEKTVTENRVTPELIREIAISMNKLIKVKYE